MKTNDCARRLLVLQTRLGDGGMVEVAVKDSGIGIAPDKLEKIFESFVTTREEGLGMGLALARSIIDRHGGRIRAANQPEGGAIFAFTLPVGN
jgi:signal transduction histidine kinase